jgi:serine/threonine-protein phosphatase 2A regulatory subunit B'
MVYNAMKLFMEINPTLFDECTQEYAAMQEAAPAKALKREQMWKMLEDSARRRQNERNGKAINGKANGPDARGGSPMETDDEQNSRENQRKMDALNIHDENKKPVGLI